MTSKTILVVDDDRHALSALASMVETLGHRVIVASGGHEALGLLTRGAHADAIVTDLRMPDMDGIDLCEQARDIQGDLPVILVTGDATGIDEALRQGALALLKPYSLDALGSVLEEAFAVR